MAKCPSRVVPSAVASQKRGRPLLGGCLRGGAPQEVVLLLGLEGSWGHQAEDWEKVYHGKTKHSPGTEFSCGWSCSNSKKAFYAPDRA